MISRVEENTYYAELLIRRDEGVISVDARSSDSIAVALRTNARIFAEDGLLQSHVIEIADEQVVECDLTDTELGLKAKMDPEQLKEYLRQLNPEDFGRFTP